MERGGRRRERDRHGEGKERERERGTGRRRTIPSVDQHHHDDHKMLLATRGAGGLPLFLFLAAEANVSSSCAVQDSLVMEGSSSFVNSFQPVRFILRTSIVVEPGAPVRLLAGIKRHHQISSNSVVKSFLSRIKSQATLGAGSRLDFFGLDMEEVDTFSVLFLLIEISFNHIVN